MTIRSTYIEVTNLRIYARIGVMAQEQTVGNDFTVNLRLYYDAGQAMNTDAVADALNYAAVINTVKRVLNCPCALLENAAARVATALTDEYPAIRRGHITIAKCKPPVAADLDSASFTLEWEA